MKLKQIWAQQDSFININNRYQFAIGQAPIICYDRRRTNGVSNGCRIKETNSPRFDVDTSLEITPHICTRHVKNSLLKTVLCKRRSYRNSDKKRDL